VRVVEDVEGWWWEGGWLWGGHCGMGGGLERERDGEEREWGLMVKVYGG
jgi:hypothetical protein